MLKKENIFLNQKFNSKDEILKDIFIKFENNKVSKMYIESILEREKMDSFNIGNSIAIPHGTYEGMQTLEKSLILFYHLENSILWDNSYVKLVIALAIKPQDQIDLLQNIAINSMVDDFFQDLLNAPTIEKIEKLTSSEE